MSFVENPANKLKEFKCEARLQFDPNAQAIGPATLSFVQIVKKTNLLTGEQITQSVIVQARRTKDGWWVDQSPDVRYGWYLLDDTGRVP